MTQLVETSVSKESALKLLMAMQGLVHQGLEFWRGTKTLQQGIAHEVGIAKESTVDAETQQLQSRNFVSQDRIGLSDLVYPLGIADAALFDLAFGLLQQF